jgi:CRP-like cAMP-binding protein
VGALLCIGQPLRDTSAVVQMPGTSFRAPAEVVQLEFARGGTLQTLLRRCVIDMMAQMGQTAVCNRYHRVDQQLCRWILMTLDRATGPVLEVTREGMARLLGARREGVGLAADKLQAEGLIVWRRGSLRVVDRAGLEQRACECYAALRGGAGRPTGFASMAAPHAG